jgi:hypothetical protein
MQETEVPAYSCRILIAGDTQDAERCCRDFCYEVGECVTVTPTSYIYTGGQERGVVVELINYARFPREPIAISHRAYALALRLMDVLKQQSCTVQDSTTSRWLSRR